MSLIDTLDTFTQFLLFKRLLFFLKILSYLGLLYNLQCYEFILPSNLNFQFVWLIILIFLTLHHLSSLYLIMWYTHHVSPPKSSPSLHGSLNKSLSFFVWCLLPNLYYLQHAALFIKSYPFFNALTKIYPTSLEQTHLSSSHLTSSYYPCNTSQVSIFPLYGPLAFHGCLILFNLITTSLISGYAHF